MNTQPGHHTTCPEADDEENWGAEQVVCVGACECECVCFGRGLIR